MGDADSYRPVLQGSRLTLRPLTPEDVTDVYCAWMKDSDVTRFIENRPEMPSKAVLRHYVRTKAANPHTVFLAITKTDDGRHIGNIKLGPIDRRNGVADIGILIGDKGSWGQGYAAEAIELLTDYAFNSLALHKVIAGCAIENVRSLRAFRKAGFDEQGVLREQCVVDGVYMDVLLLARINK